MTSYKETRGTQRTIWTGEKYRVQIRTDRRGGIAYRVEYRHFESWSLLTIKGNKEAALKQALDALKKF